MKIGLDFGGVIVKIAEENLSKGDFIEEVNAISSISKLINDYENEVWIISKASKSTQAATRVWLNKVKFYKNTGFISSNLFFCSKRHEKRELCKPLGITHFIDDNIEVLQALKGLIPNLFLFGTSNAPEGFIAVNDWDELLKKLTIV